ncbi:MAG: alpha/beta hydrolase-fold protein [Anaeromyxobacter sp.]
MRTSPALPLALLALATAARPAAAQEDIRLVTLRSAAYQGERQLVVRTPAAYDRPWERDRRYPVVYFTDGLANLDGLAASARFLERLGRIPPVVLVGLVHRDRAAELADGEPTLLAFLETEVVPWVEKTYRAAPLRILAGHGDGARFALRVLATRPGVFRAHLVMSPRLSGEDPLLGALAAAAARPGLAGTVIATRGDEGAASAAGLRRLGEALAPAKGVTFTALELPGEDPVSAVFPGQHRGLSALFAPFRMPVAEGDAGPRGGLAAVEAHYEALSRRVGFEVTPPEAVANAAARQLLQEGEVDEAIRAYRRNVERYPGSASAHDALGEAYERNGELEAAMRAYAKAVDVAARVKDPSLPALERKLARLGATVESQRLGAGGR